MGILKKCWHGGAVGRGREEHVRREWAGACSYRAEVSGISSRQALGVGKVEI